MIKTILISILACLSATYSLSQTIAPDFSLHDTNGEQHTLYNELNQGTAVVLNFFSIYCSTCQSESQVYEQMWQSHLSNNDNVVFWGIESSGSADSLVKNFAQEYNLTYPLLPTFNDDTVLSLYNITYTPRYFVVCMDKKTKYIDLENIEWLLQTCIESVDIENLYDKEEFKTSYSNGSLNIQNIKNNAGYCFTIINDLGAIIQKGNIPFMTINYSIPLSLKKGIYFIEISNFKNRYSGKFIVE